MKRYLLALGVCLATLGTSVLATEPVHTKDSLDAVKENLKAAKAVLVDVREQSEWDQGHVEGAVHVPLSEVNNPERFAKHLKKLDKGKIVYTHCKAGIRALHAAEPLEKQGFQVRPLKAGFSQLLEAGFPQAENKKQ